MERSEIRDRHYRKQSRIPLRFMRATRYSWKAFSPGLFILDTVFLAQCMCLRAQAGRLRG
jgi:hypothetical protein